MRLQPENRMEPLHAAFIMEQALGHVTHYRNLRQFADGVRDVTPVWVPIPFEVSGAARWLPLVRSNWSVRASWRARRALEAIHARDSLDALVFHTQVTSLFSVGLMRRVPSIISLDATPINYDSVGKHYGHRIAGDRFIDRQAFQLNRRAFHAASGLVTWSDWARRSLIDDYGVDASKVRVVPPGASPQFFEIGSMRQAPRPERERHRVRLLFVGGNFERKGGRLLLQLMRGRLGDVCELHLATQDAVAAQPNVVVHRGLQPNSAALRRLFADADIFVLPTLADCLAVVAQEAAAAGLPVVTTDVGAMSEAVVAGVTGLIVPPANRQALESALMTLVDDPRRRAQMGRASYVRARGIFDANRNHRALLDFVQELASDRAHRARRAA